MIKLAAYMPENEPHIYNFSHPIMKNIENNPSLSSQYPVTKIIDAPAQLNLDELTILISEDLISISGSPDLVNIPDPQ